MFADESSKSTVVDPIVNDDEDTANLIPNPAPQVLTNGMKFPPKFKLKN